MSYIHTNEAGGLLSEWIENLREIKQRHSLQRLGFKVLYRDIEVWGDSISMALTAGSVLLVTRDPFFEAVSAVTARTTGIWDSLDADKPNPFVLDLSMQEVREEMSHSIDWNMRARKLLHDLDVQFVEIKYREDAQEAFDFGPVLDFLGISGSKPSMSTSRLSRLLANPEQQIGNWNQILSLQSTTRLL